MKTYNTEEMKAWFHENKDTLFDAVSQFSKELPPPNADGTFLSDDEIYTQLGERLRPLIPDASFVTLYRLTDAVLKTMKAVLTERVMEDVGELLKMFVPTPAEAAAEPPVEDATLN